MRARRPYADAMLTTRSSTRYRSAIAVLIAAVLVGHGALVGCSVSPDDDEPSKARATQSPEATKTVTEEPTRSPSPSPSASASQSTAPSSSPSTSPAANPKAALLTAPEMPQLNSSSPWKVVRTGVAGTRPFGLCQKFDLLTIGATEAVERTFTHEGDTAGQQVAEFADAQTAVRASKVLEAWHRSCAGRVRGQRVRVRPITDVAVTKGTGWNYLVSFDRRGTGHFHSLGLVLSGPRMTVLRMDHDGQDHNYRPGKDPMELAVKSASARMG
jgi:hypothetical protein